MSIEHEPRIRVPWSPRGERPWCPGASHPRPDVPAVAPATGWSGLFRVHTVLERWRANVAAKERHGDVSHHSAASPSATVNDRLAAIARRAQALDPERAPRERGD